VRGSSAPGRIGGRAGEVTPSATNRRRCSCYSVDTHRQLPRRCRARIHARRRAASGQPASAENAYGDRMGYLSCGRLSLSTPAARSSRVPAPTSSARSPGRLCLIRTTDAVLPWRRPGAQHPSPTAPTTAVEAVDPRRALAWTPARVLALPLVPFGVRPGSRHSSAQSRPSTQALVLRDLARAWRSGNLRLVVPNDRGNRFPSGAIRRGCVCSRRRGWCAVVVPRGFSHWAIMRGGRDECDETARPQ
jgi:hypothetical protein